MKKIFNFCMIALVAMMAFTSCSEDCDHEFIEHDFTQEIVGTWTFLNGEQAEAMVIKADGSFTTTGVMKGGALYEEKGTIKVVNNKVTLAFDGDKETFEGRLEFVAGKSMSIVMFDDNDVRLTYDYCENDLSDEVVGMWVCTQTNLPETNMTIQTYQEDGKSIFTGFSPNSDSFMTNLESTYNVVGDLMFQKTGDMYFVTRLAYVPNGTSFGDILNTTSTIWVNDAYVTSSYSFLRVKQNLNLAGKAYDYNNLYLSNVKGKDQDINFWGYTMNLATMDGTGLDKMLKAILFHIEFPNANTISYTYTMGNNQESFSAPIKVEGNKLTVKMSDKVSTLKDIVYYAYQDADDSQMHLYMSRSAFVNFYTNMQALMLEGTDAQFDINNAEAIDAIYNSINDVVESINLSIVMK